MAGGVKSADRVLSILEALATTGGLTFPELVLGLDLPKSSLHGLLQTLRNRDWVTLDDRSHRYGVGVQAWQTGQCYSNVVDLIRHSRKPMSDLRDLLGETIELAILEGTDTVYVAKVEAKQALRLVSQVGVHLPAHATALGKIMLASLTDAEIRAMYMGLSLQIYTSRTVRTMSQLLRELRIVRSRGYSRADGDFTEGVTCLAVPVRDRRGAVVAGLSCAAPTFRLQARADPTAEIVDSLNHAAHRISVAWGYEHTNRGQLAKRSPEEADLL